MLSKNLVEKGIGAVALLGIFWTLYVRYVPPEKRQQIRMSKTGRTMLDLVIFVGCPIFVHALAWSTLLLTLIVAAIVSACLSWPEIKETFLHWKKRRQEKKEKIPEQNLVPNMA